MNFPELFAFFTLLFSMLWMIGKFPFFKLSGLNVSFLQFAFLLKAFSGMLIYLIYTYHYPARNEADTFKYFDDSKALYDALWIKPLDFFKMLFGLGCENNYFFNTYYVKMNNWYLAHDNGFLNDGRLIIRLNAVFRICSFGNYHIHSLLLNFISFIGLYSILRLFMCVSHSKWKSYVAAFLVPSTVFWTSGVLKESVLIFALGLFCWILYQLMNKPFKWKYVMYLFFLIPVLLTLKFYVFLAILTAILGYVLAKKWHSNLLACVGSLVGIFLVTRLIHLIFPSYDLIKLLVQKQHAFIDLALKTDAQSFIKTQKLDDYFATIIQTLPSALWNTLTRPWFTDVHHPLFIPPLLENLLLFGLLMIALLKPRSLQNNEKSFLLFCLLFSWLLFSIIGLTTPIIGAMVRYKVPALPFLFFALFLLTRTTFLDRRLEPLFDPKRTT